MEANPDKSGFGNSPRYRWSFGQPKRPFGPRLRRSDRGPVVPNPLLDPTVGNQGDDVANRRFSCLIS